MRHHTLLAVLLLSTSLWAGCATGGASCSNIATARDPFAGERRGFVLRLDWLGYTAVGVFENAGKYSLQMMVVSAGQHRAAAPEGTVGHFALDGKVVRIKTEAEAQPVTNANQTTVYTQWKLLFPLTSDQAARFANAPLEAVKVSIGSNEYQLPLKPAQQEKFQTSVGCLTRSEATAATAAAD